jgi:REP element-mobilizing transposase RayT
METSGPSRKALRWKFWDYSTPGDYFVTICTEGKVPLFGAVAHGHMILNEAGKMVQRVWNNLPEHYPGMESGEAVVMPNHFHGIVRIIGRDQSPARTVGVGLRANPLSLPDIMRNFKSYTTSQFFKVCCPAGGAPRKLWHRSYWDVIVQDEKALANIQNYIRFNPQNYEAVMLCGEPRFIGNQALLTQPKVGFLASRGASFMHGTLPMCKDEAILSGFLSPLERQVFLAGLKNKRPLIWVKPWSLDEGLNVSAIQTALAEGRLLVLSPFEKSTAPSVRRALWCNEYVIAQCQRLVVGHLNPEGMLSCILSEADPDKQLVYL